MSLRAFLWQNIEHNPASFPERFRAEALRQVKQLRPARLRKNAMPHRLASLRSTRINRLFTAVLSGVAGAFGAHAFHLALLFAERHIIGSDGGMVEAAYSLPAWRRFITPLLGALAVGALLACFAFFRKRRPNAHPIDYIEGILVDHGGLDEAGSFVCCMVSVLAVACGLPVGREGGMILMASLAASLATRFVSPEEDRPLFMACGAAAGMAAAYQAPVAGVFFALELILGTISPAMFGPVAVASASSFCVSLAFGSGEDLYGALSLPQTELAVYLAAPFIGAAFALAGSAFLWAMDYARFLSDRFQPFVRLLAAGVCAGGLSVWVPEVWGNGHSVVRSCLENPPALEMALIFLGAKALAMLFCHQAGIPGGFFTPTMFIGATLGLALSHGFTFLLPQPGLGLDITLMGIGCVLASTTRSPLMSAFLVCELTGSYPLLAALLPATAIASALSARLHRLSIYKLPLSARD